MAVVLPPPVTGQTLASRALVRHLGQAAPPGAVAIHPVSGGGAAWRVHKQTALLAAILRAAAAGRGRDALYLVVDSGAGLWAQAAAAPVLRTGFSRVVLHHHGFAPLRRRDPRLAALLSGLGDRARHIVLCPGMATALVRHYAVAPDRIRVLGNAALIPAPPRAPARPADIPLTLGFLGNITRSKGIGAFMATPRALAEAGRPVRALIAGPVTRPDLEAEIAWFLAEDPAGRSALGPVSGPAKRRFLAGIDALLFPSAYPNEAQPFTIFEALAAGRPVLATPIGGIPGQIERAWCLPAPGFAAAAARIVAGWQDRPETHAAACAAARARFEAAQARDVAALWSVTRWLLEGAE
ncbi:glycosyltransferase family 4 protein [Rhodovulum sp. YNF3179]|uniref:glycosyltransferase family 4 protein n=1 Tax=Rhodovulum sp. YNF3179 TaxID=3425127 RepID=UPI003D32C2D5